MSSELLILIWKYESIFCENNNNKLSVLFLFFLENGFHRDTPSIMLSEERRAEICKKVYFIILRFSREKGLVLRTIKPFYFQTYGLNLFLIMSDKISDIES